MPSPHRIAGAIAGSLAVALFTSLPSRAIASPDSTATRVIYQDTVVVAASKSRSRLADLATTASVIGPAQIRLGTARSVQDVLAQVPGAHVLDLSGSETGGAVEARGFAAQGTSSPMVVLVDEIPINDFETGKVDWNVLGQSQVQHVEFLRGPASFLYGNATMAGLVNIVTLAPGSGTAMWGQAAGGSEGRASGAGGASWNGARAQGSLSASLQRLDGFRDHSAWSAASGYGFGSFALSPRWGVRARMLAHGAEQETPGPLPDPLWKTEPKRTQTPADDRRDRTFDAALELRGNPWRTLDLVVLGSGHANRLEATETIFPVGALDRESRVRGARGEARLHWTPMGTPTPDLLVGVELRAGSLESRYFDPGSGGALVGAGNVRRTSGGVFALARAEVGDALTLGAGARADWMRSRLDDPTDASPVGPNDDLRAISPTIGASVALRNDGHAWLSYAGAFKAPEIDQLYDRRPFDFGFGPFQISSNVLQPQRGDHWEAGARTRFGPSAWLDGAIFAARSRDEIGFDLANFRLSNIARSRHVGFEGQLATAPVRGVSGTLSYAWTRATFDGGPHDGKQINTVPEHQLFTRVSLERGRGGSISAELALTARQWIDEEERYALPDAALVNLGATQTAGPFELFASVRNVADRRVATLGFVTIDAFGNDLPLYFPGAGRSFSIGARLKRGGAGTR